MLSKSQQDKIARKYTAVVVKAMDTFPRLLESCEVDEAAAIVADVIKAHIPKAMPEPQPDESSAGDKLDQLVCRLAMEDGLDPDN